MDGIVGVVLLPFLFVVFIMLIAFLTLSIVDYIKEYNLLKIKGSTLGITLTVMAVVITAINIGLMAIK